MKVLASSRSVRTPKPVPPLRDVAVVAVDERRARDVEVHPRHAVDELLQEQPGGERAAVTRAPMFLMSAIGESMSRR